MIKVFFPLLRLLKKKVEKGDFALLTIFHQRARKHPAEFGFQSLDSDLPRRCGNVLEKKGKKAKISSLSLVCGSIGWQHGYSISSAVVAELK